MYTVCYPEEEAKYLKNRYSIQYVEQARVRYTLIKFVDKNVHK